MSTFSWVYNPYAFWNRLPPQKKSTHQHFLSANNPYENNKNLAKKLKVYRKNVDFHRPSPPKVYGLYTHENVDIHGRPLIMCMDSRSVRQWLQFSSNWGVILVWLCIWTSFNISLLGLLYGGQIRIGTKCLETSMMWPQSHDWVSVQPLW